MIYVFKIYDLKELRDFDLFAALGGLSDNRDVEEFDDMIELNNYVKEEFNAGQYGYMDEPEYIAVVDVEKRKIFKRTYTLNLKVKTFKTDEEIQELIDLESKKVKEAQKKKEKANKITQKV